LVLLLFPIMKSWELISSRGLSHSDGAVLPHNFPKHMIPSPLIWAGDMYRSRVYDGGRGRVVNEVNKNKLYLGGGLEVTREG